jgi:hypothetical protein
MADVTYYVAMPFLQDDGGAPVAGGAEECQSSSSALRRAEVLSRGVGSVGAVAFSRTGDPMTGEFGDAQLLKKFGNVPDDLSLSIRHRRVANASFGAARRVPRHADHVADIPMFAHARSSHGVVAPCAHTSRYRLPRGPFRLPPAARE